MKFIIPQSYIDEDRVACKKHPKYDLWIYTYTRNTMENNLWDDITLACRGLVLDKDQNIIARSMPKFFNQHEIKEELPNEPYGVFEKMDGSLILAFKYKGDVITCTKRSFESDQAIVAYDIIKTNNYDICIKDENKTYLFELIHPDNRIVVDYEGIKDLYYITTVDNNTGLDSMQDDMYTPYVKEYDKTLEEIMAEDRPNAEGYVVKFAGGYRLKVKHPTYLKLHRIMSMLTTEDVWEDALNVNFDLLTILSKDNEDLFNEVSLITNDLVRQYNAIKSRAVAISIYIDTRFETKKDKVLYVQKFFPDIQHVVYSILNGYDDDDTRKVIYKLIKPKKIGISKIYDGVML